MEYGGDAYGSAALESALKMRAKRRQRMNWFPVIIFFLCPVIMCAGTAAALTFGLRANEPAAAWGIVAALFVVCLMFFWHLGETYRETGKGQLGAQLFFTSTLTCGWFVGLLAGLVVYAAVMSSYYEISSLAKYTNIDPSSKFGEQLMDAGVVTFTSNTSVNDSMASGFKSHTIYCVAPISSNGSAYTYDFWAVGTDCCTGSSGSFECGDIDDPDAFDGVRLMDDTAQGYYKLAVKEAEAAYGITSNFPLFFTWEDDATDAINAKYTDGEEAFIAVVAVFAVFQFIATIVATIAFIRLGGL